MRVAPVTIDPADYSMTDADIRELVAHEVEAGLTSCVNHVLARELAWRVEKELLPRIAQAVEKQLPDALRQYSLVALPDVNDAVRRCVQAVISERLTALLGVGSITVGLVK